MPKDESPQITSIPPITTECPYDEEPSECVERETRDWVNARYSNVQDESISIIPEEIIIEVRRKNRKLEKYTIPSEDWPCVQDALDDFRLRFSNVISNEYHKIKSTAVQDIIESIRFTCPQPLIKEVIKTRTIKVPVPSERELEIERLLNPVGLQRGTRQYKELEQLADTRLNRWTTDIIKMLVKSAREAIR